MSRRLWTAPLSLACLVLCAVMAQAQRQRAYRGSYQSVRQTILRLENRANLFRNGVDDWSQSSNANYDSNGEFNTTARGFNEGVRRLRDNFDRRRATSSDVQDILNSAARIDDFVRLNSLDARTQNLWSSMRVDLNQLASAFNLTWQTSTYNPPYGSPTSGYPTYGNQYGVQALTGTYRIDRARSEDARLAAERAARSLPTSERTRVLDLVSRRLDPPDEIAIDLRGRQVTLASTRAPQVSFDADGQDRIETSPAGRTIHLRAGLSGNQLTVNSSGDSGNEFNVIFQAADNGRTLNVTRRIYLPELNQSVQVRSTYQKTSDVARFEIYNPANTTQYPGNTTQYPRTTSGGFIVPDGARIVGMLDGPLSTRTAAIGDGFTLRVTEPAEFSDATIEGHVSSIERSGRLSGRSIMTLDFDNIRLRDGRRYQFAGLLESVATRNGETVRVDTEGAVRDQNQTTRTEERAAIGTAVGAIIGAIAGGGRGAAIGAILGAGAGAGSIYAEGRNDLDLDRGTELVIRAGAPYSTPR